MITSEGCATLCNEYGNLLFYTDGIHVWNRNHQIMPNGNNLFGNQSSTQSGIIVPKPGSTSIYYIFTVVELAKPDGVCYSIVDMDLDNGNGDITSKNIQILTPTLEKINVVKHFNEIDYWLISHKFNSNSFYAYKISSTGLSTPIVSNVGTPIGISSQNTLGYLKSSPNGKFLACANSSTTSSSMQLFNFDTSTGAISLISTSNFQNDDDGIGVYGVEFSNDSNLLYVTNIDFKNKTSQIYQFNIQSQNQTIINNSQTLIEEYINPNSDIGTMGALQLAPDKKIYVAKNKENFLGIINNPDIVGLGCQYISQGFSLGDRICYYGLPAFITSLFDVSFVYSNPCLGSLTQFNIPNIPNVVNIFWDFGDTASPNNFSNLAQPTHLFSSAGSFTVTLTVQTTTSTKTFSRQLTIQNRPIANPMVNYNLCEESTDSAAFDLSTKNSEILGNQSSLNYSVSYYSNLQDAQNKQNPLPNTYINASNPETVFARIQTRNNDGCYDITNFDLIVNKKPILESNLELIYCSDTFPNKITLSSGNMSPINNLTYLWSTSETTESIQVNTEGTYNVEVSTVFNCKSKRTIKVKNSEIAKINYTINGEIGNYSLIINAVGTGNYLYALNNINGSYQISPVFDNLAPGNHVIYVKDSNGCGIASDNVSVIGYPNFFTPNNDGINDTWSLSENFMDFKELFIFDRFGKLIKVLSPNNKEWDGAYLGKKLPASDYWFKLTLNNNQTINGHFTLKR